MKIDFFSLSSLILIVFSSCEKTEKVDNFPKHESKLVANCFFQSDSVFEFKLYKSLSPLDNAPFKKLNNQQISFKIFENNILYDSLHYKALTGYVGNKKPRAGNTYRFECNYPGFGLVSGDDYLPDSSFLQKYSGFFTTSRIYSSNDSVSKGEFNLNLSIEYSRPNQYLMVRIVDFHYLFTGQPGYYNYNGIDYLSDLNTANSSEYINNMLFVSNLAGVKSLKLRASPQYFALRKTGTNAYYSITTYACSKAAYEYLKRQALQIENNDDPFSQPTPISNNIINGYGIFGGINISQQYISF